MVNWFETKIKKFMHFYSEKKKCQNIVPLLGRMSLFAIASRNKLKVICFSFSKRVKNFIFSSRSLSRFFLRLSSFWSSSVIESNNSMHFPNSCSLKWSINLKIWGCLGNARPRTAFKDSRLEVVLILRSATERVLVLFCAKMNQSSLNFMIFFRVVNWIEKIYVNEYLNEPIILVISEHFLEFMG